MIRRPPRSPLFPYPPPFRSLARRRRPPHASRLRFGELPNRRPAADPCVALPDLLHELRRRGSPATHILEVRLDLVEAPRAAVRHQQHGNAPPPISRHAPTRRPSGGLPPASRGARHARD